MPSGVYDRSDQSKWKPNSGRFKKGEHRNPDTEFKKGIHPDNVWVKGIGYTGERNFYTDAEWRRKQSLSHKGQHSSPETEIKRGQRLSPGTEFKESTPGGVSTEEMLIRNSPDYRQWRKEVYTRDNFTCQRCGSRGRLESHHIKSFAEFPELRFDVDNGITYCLACHDYEHARHNIITKLSAELQLDRRKVLLLRLDVLDKHNTPYLISTRGFFQSYSINPDTLIPLPRIKSKKTILREFQLSLFGKEVMPDAVK
jgi:hypothetical protein